MRILLLIITTLLLQEVQAQDYFHYIQFAEEAKAADDPYGAMQYYQKAFVLDSSDQALQYAYAEALEATHYYREAERLYQKIYSKGRGRSFPQGASRIAQLKMYLGEYEASIKFWNRALRHAEDRADKDRMQQRMKACSYALSHPLAIDSILVINAGEGINTIESEYGADLFGEGSLLFGSLRGNYNESLELRKESTYYSRIYQSTNEGYGYLDAMQFKSNMDSLKGHQGNPCPDPLGEYLYFTELDPNGFRTIKRLNLFSETGAVESMGQRLNLKGSNNTQPYVFLDSSDEVHILFSSDRPGGQGGYDLWTGKIEGRDLTDLRNLGSTINSPGNEVTPAYNQSSGLLFFSSDWHEGYGAYDIFKTEWNGSTRPQSIENLGLPINSSVNDLYYRERGDIRLLTSNREGSLTEHATHCCNDIYFIEDRPEEDLSGIIYNVLPERIEGVDELRGLLPISLYFHNDIPNPGSNSNVSKVNYEATAIEYLDMEEEYIAKYSSDLKGLAKDTAALKMHLFFAEQVRAEFNELEGVSRLIYSELEKGKEIEIAIKGYASPLAKSDYNRKLTQRRIASVVNYLRQLDEGILRPYMGGENPALRIVPIPYGEEESEAFVSDNPQDAKSSIYSIAAARERRVEILRIQEVK
jgi:hypothetical protein